MTSAAPTKAKGGAVNPLPSPSLSVEERSSLFSRLLFLWVIPIFKELYRKRASLSHDDIPALPSGQTPEIHIARMKRFWEEERRKPKPSCTRTVLRFAKPWLIKSIVLMWTMLAINLLLPFGSALIVKVIEKEIELTYAYVIIAGIVFACVVASTMQQAAWHNQYSCAFGCWAALSALIYEKPIHLTSADMASFQQGELVNMIAADCQVILEVMTYTVVYCMVPFQTVVCVILLLVILGTPALLGVSVLVVNIACSDRLGHTVKKLQALKNKKADLRAMVLNEGMQGVRTVKMNAWELYIEDKVNEKRQEEMAYIVTSGYFRAVQSFLAFGLPTLSTVATTILYEHVSGNLDPATIFMAVAFFEYLNMSMAIMPNAINEYRRMHVSIKRIERLLLAPDSYKPPDMGHGDGRVTVKGADFSYSQTNEDGFQLRDIHMAVEPGSMVAIVGRVGAGKTTLANALLSQVTRTKGELAVEGTTALVSQSPFIMNDTVRENVVFGSDYDKALYDSVIAACCLESDLKQFVGGDMTEVGEKGITISGGQKQRICIARAVYSMADVLVFDDPLSAMDMHVGRQVFENVFQGMLAHKTRIFVTNQLHFCEECDYIYLLDEGRVVEAGTYQELMDQMGTFQELMMHVTGEGQGADLEGVELHEGRVSVDAHVQPCVDTDAPTAATIPTTAAIHKDLMSPSAPVHEAKDTKTEIMQKEVKAEGRVGVRTLISFCRAANSTAWGLLTATMIIVAPINQIAVNLFLARWADASAKNKPAEEKNRALLYYVICTSVFAAVAAARCTSLTIFNVRASTNLHKRMLQAVLRSPMVFFDTTPVGRILARFTNDMQLLDIQFPRISEVWAFLCGMALITVVMTGVVVPQAALLSAVLLASAVMVYKYYGAVLLELQRLQMMAVGPCVASYSAFLMGLDSIRAFGRVPNFVRKFNMLQARFMTCVYHSASVERLVFSFAVSIGISLFLGILCIVLVAFRDSDFVTPGVAGFLLSYCGILCIRVPPALFTTANMERMLGSVQRIVEYTQLPPEAENQKQMLKVPGWPKQGSIEFQNVFMRYRPELPYTLKGVSFSILSGEKLGVVGRTGAGKSSVMMTLLRMVELESGSIQIDGVDTSTLSVYNLRKRLGVIPQESYMFSGTVRSNLDVYGEYTDESLWEVLEMVDLKQMVRGLDGGKMLDAEVSERGDNFSAGTIQLMCLARVLLKKPSIILMDEATASVDLATDTKIQETIRTGFDGCTIVTVAHRLQTIIDFDRVLVMDYGQVAELDTPAALCVTNREGLFANLVQNTGEASAKELRARARRSQARKLVEASSDSAASAASSLLLHRYASTQSLSKFGSEQNLAECGS